MAIDRSRRISFDQVAELYDQVRPRYPEQVIEDVITLAGIAPGGRMLEVGCGPGIATVAFAQRGYAIVAVELGEQLATLAKKNCARYPQVQIITISFEEWELQPQAFDLVLSAEAFHWIRPEIGYPKMARALKAGGSAALLWNVYEEAGGELYAALDAVYQKQDPPVENPNRAVTPDWLIDRITQNFAASECFGTVTVRQYPWSKMYTGEDYIKLLSTMSGFRTMQQTKRTRLFDEILAVIQRFDGWIEQRLDTVLFQANR